MRRIKHLLRDFSGHTGRELGLLLLAQVDAAIEGARLARDAATSRAASQELRQRMTDIEHEGDAQRARLVDALGQALVTPIDREDLFRLSRSVDDVLDNLRDFSRELRLYEVSGEIALPIIDRILEALVILREAVGMVGESPKDVTGQALVAKKSVNEIQRTHQEQMAELLNGTVTPDMLRGREMLGRLEAVGLRLGEAADALADGVIKRSH